nr:serine/threonine-protein kinase BLUS1-like [Ipomoea batatas]
MVVKNTEIHTYLVFDHKPIGSSSGMVVYRAVWQLTTTKLVLNRSVALKVADNPDSIAKLRGEVTRSLGVKGQHRNLLRFKTCFMDEQSGKFCVVMPLTHGSFRTIMLHKNHWFSQGGFPKRHVLVILRSLLRALTFLHTQHIFHGDISAAHIYLCNSSHPLYYHCSHIALSFAATIYEVAAKWVAAPEIYYANQPYSEKADIWLVGITALELAYGGDLLLKLKNRNALEAMIKEIHDNKKLPTNINIYHQMKKTSIHTILKKEVGEDELMMNKLKFYIKKWVPFRFRSSLPGIAGTFAEIVVQCLDWDPKNRPTAHMLLYHPCFNGWPYASFAGRVVRCEAIYDKTIVDDDEQDSSMMFRNYVFKAALFSTTMFDVSKGFRRDSITSASETFYVVKAVDENNGGSILKAREEVRRNMAAMEGERHHKNLLRMKAYFMDKPSGKLCIVMPFPGHSLRTVMKKAFPGGFPEDLMLSALRSVLDALGFLHTQSIFHTDINAGHVYLGQIFCDIYDVDLQFEYNYEINLGFAATVYDDDDEMGNTAPYLPVASMSNWAAAPEVYNGNGKQAYSDKADIWLFGITALELAFGGLKLPNRNALEAIIDHIHHNNKLPIPAKNSNNNYKQEKHDDQGANNNMFKMAFKYLLQPFSSSNAALVPLCSLSPYDEESLTNCPSSSSNHNEDYCSFSETFTDMVMKCLAWDSEKRPSFNELMSHNFFTQDRDRLDGYYLLYQRQSLKVFVKYWLWSFAVFGSVVEMIMKLDFLSVSQFVKFDKWFSIFFVALIIIQDVLTKVFETAVERKKPPYPRANGREIPRLGG